MRWAAGTSIGKKTVISKLSKGNDIGFSAVRKRQDVCFVMSRKGKWSRVCAKQTKVQMTKI